jgi:hypothetical protein
MGYVVENVPSAQDQRPLVRLGLRSLIHWFGQPFVLDAAQVGARAHRVRYLWTNMVPHSVLKQVKMHTVRPPNLTVQQILEPGRRARKVDSSPNKGQYPCNKVGLPRLTLPTLVSRAASYAFRDHGPGMIYDDQKRCWTEPTPLERERAMSMIEHATAHPHLTDAQRNALIGNSFDVAMFTWLFTQASLYQGWVRQYCLTDSTSNSTNDVGGMSAETGGKSQTSKGDPMEKYTSDIKPLLKFGEGLDEEWKEKFACQAQSYRRAFAVDMQELGKFNGWQIDLRIKEGKPVFRRQRTWSPGEQELIKVKTQELKDADIVSPSISSTAHQIVLPYGKPNEQGDYAQMDRRLCVDLSPSNVKADFDAYPIPTMEEIVIRLAQDKPKIFACLDVRASFLQLELTEKSRPLTAFWGHKELLQYNRLPFGFKNGTQAQQRVIDFVLRGIEGVHAYVDDCIISATSELELLSKMARVYERFIQYGLTFHPKKCLLGSTKVPFLGHM